MAFWLAGWPCWGEPSLTTMPPPPRQHTHSPLPSTPLNHRGWGVCCPPVVSNLQLDHAGINQLHWLCRLLPTPNPPGPHQATCPPVSSVLHQQLLVPHGVDTRRQLTAELQDTTTHTGTHRHTHSVAGTGRCVRSDGWNVLALSVRTPTTTHGVQVARQKQKKCGCWRVGWC